MLQRDSHFSGFFRDVRCDGETFAIMLVRNKNRNLPEKRVERATLNNTFARRRQPPITRIALLPSQTAALVCSPAQ